MTPHNPQNSPQHSASSIACSQASVALLRIQANACKPFKGAFIHAWHTKPKTPKPLVHHAEIT